MYRATYFDFNCISKQLVLGYKGVSHAIGKRAVPLEDILRGEIIARRAYRDAGVDDFFEAEIQAIKYVVVGRLFIKL